jgi:hypothetical protein
MLPRYKDGAPFFGDANGAVVRAGLALLNSFIVLVPAEGMEIASSFEVDGW